MRPGLSALPIVLAASALAYGCAAPSSLGPYSPGDPLSGAPQPRDYFRVDPSTSAGRERGPALFAAVVPDGWRASSGRLSDPIVAIFTKELYAGEAQIVVERYPTGSDPVAKESFARNLLPGRDAPPLGRHLIAGATYAVYHGLDFESYHRPVQAGDPYGDALGSSYAPPRLSLLEARRFPAGGQAYRLYRCRKLGAWSLLGDYRRARDKGRLEEFRLSGFGPTERRIIGACFGKAVLLAVDAGGPVSRIAKPSLSRLRVMARDEWVHAATRLVERECVHLRDAPGGFIVLRYRAPVEEFRREHPAFETFLGSFAAADNP